MDVVNTYIEEGSCPFTNGILTCNGIFYRLIHERTGSGQSILVEEDNFSDLINSEFETSFEVITVVENDLWIAYGCETSWGSEGAIYVFDKQKSIFMWLLVLENGNPFSTLDFKGDTLITTDSTERFEEGWVIPINEPWQISYWKEAQPR